jgi:hypothetical protein
MAAVPTQNELVMETVVEVVLRINNPDVVKISGNSGRTGESGGILRHGYSARADIKTAQPRTIHIIPYSAIMQDDIGEYVYIVHGNTATRRDILTGIELSRGAEVVAGLNVSDEVIVTPDTLSEDTLVRRAEEE